MNARPILVILGIYPTDPQPICRSQNGPLFPHHHIYYFLFISIHRTRFLSSIHQFNCAIPICTPTIMIKWAYIYIAIVIHFTPPRSRLTQLILSYTNCICMGCFQDIVYPRSLNIRQYILIVLFSQILYMTRYYPPHTHAKHTTGTA
mgnify:CR=1 FL=1